MVFWVRQRMPGRPLHGHGSSAGTACTPLRARLLDLAGARAASAYLAHTVLRQVDWSLRHHPAAIATRHHLRLARAIVADIRSW
jgi:hypothetical protein